MVGRVNDDSVRVDMEEFANTDDVVILDSVDVGEDGTDDDFALESVKDVARGKFGLVLRPNEVDNSEFVDDSEPENVKDVILIDVELTPRSVKLGEGTIDDDPVLEDVRDVRGVEVDVVSRLESVLVLAFSCFVCVSEAGIVLVSREVLMEETTTELGQCPEIEEINVGFVEGRAEDGLVPEGLVDVAPMPDKVPELSVPPVEDESICAANLVEVLVGREVCKEELNANLLPNPRLDVGDAETSDKVVDIVSDAGSMGTFVAFGDFPSPGMFNGKHVEGRGIEVLNNDQGPASSSRSSPSTPSVASNPKSTSMITSLTTSTPVLEAPVSLLQAPPSSTTRPSAHYSSCLVIRRKDKRTGLRSQVYTQLRQLDRYGHTHFSSLM